MLSKKLIFLISLIFSSSFNYAQNAWGAEVFLKVEEKSLRYVLNEIRNQSNINLIYDDKLINEKTLTCSINSTAEKAIKEVLTKTGFSFRKFENNSAVIFPKNSTVKKTKAVVSNKNIEKKFVPINNELLKPTLISNLNLVYPESAIKKGIEGEVLARILVSKSGTVADVKVEISSGYEVLDTATINYVRKLKFLPAEINGKYYKAWTSMLVKFNFE